MWLDVCLLSSALTLDDDVRAIGNLINGFIHSITFGRDFEQQLSFYVEARGSFSNIDVVLMFLVQVATLPWNAIILFLLNCFKGYFI